MNIYVGNLSFNATESELREAFSQFGEVTSCAIIKDKFSQQSKGFGFVEMSDKSAAENAIKSLNGKDMGGRPLTVNEAKPQADRGGSRDRGGNRDRRW